LSGTDAAQRLVRPGRPAWALAVHGGAKEIAADEEAANRDGCAAALAAGRAILERGGSALDAVEAAVRSLEDDPVFNAGRGSVRNAAGEVEMCAAIMSGIDLAVGAVTVVKGMRHPVSVARLLLGEHEILLAGEGAHDFAAHHGIELLASERPLFSAFGTARRSGHDTVGAVALDQDGNLAAATSTGGLAGTLPGRIGDSPLPGCGYYADNRLGAIALSGDGEAIARQCIAIRVIDNLDLTGPEAALEQALSKVAQLQGEAGAILIDRNGRIAWSHNSPHFAVGFATDACPDGRVRLGKDEA